jgi:hypothetical protein
MIYLWDLPDLIKDLKDGVVPTWKIRLYCFLSPFMSLLNGLLFSILLVGHHIVEHSFKGWVKKPHPSIDFYNYWGTSLGFLTIITACLGIYLCYRANNQGDGKDFWSRMACLSFPINFNITMYTIAALGVVSFLAYFFFESKIAAFQQKCVDCPLIATPFLPGKVNKFANRMRTMILMAYPVLALLPAFLSFIHYAVVRILIKDVAKNQAPTLDHRPFDKFD